MSLFFGHKFYKKVPDQVHVITNVDTLVLVNV